MANPFAQYAQPSANPFAQYTMPADAGEVPAARQEPSSLTRFGRAAASLADTIVGDIPSMVVGQVAYPVARAFGQSPEEATQTSEGLSKPIASPFGKAFGVEQTPDYQQEASRQLMDFVGENIGKGSSWIAQQTGLPESDVQSMIGTSLLAAPQVAKGAKQGVAATTQAVKEIPAVKARTERIAQERSAASWERSSQIDAAKAANRLGIALNPAQSNPTVRNKATVGMVGEAIVNEKAATTNAVKWNQIAREDLGLPESTPLTPKAFDAVREKHSAPYDNVRKIDVLRPNESTLSSLDGVRIPELIGGAENKAKIDRLVDDAINKVGEGISGDMVVKNIREQRKQANAVYNAQKKGDLVSPSTLAEADARMGIANVLESLVESNLKDPKALKEFRDARTALAKTYDWERATGVTTKQVDPMEIVKLAEKGKTFTGVLADVANIAGNFPDIASLTRAREPMMYERMRRGGVGGTIGFALGGGPVGAAVGAGATYLGSNVLAKRMTGEAAQNRLAVPQDYRRPLPQMEQPVIPRERSVVPYVAPQELLMPGEGPYQPNFTIPPATNPYAARMSMGVPEGGPAALPAPSAQSTMNALRAEDARRAAMSRELGQAAESRQAAAEAATRRPTGGEVILDFDPITQRYRTGSQGLKGATPATFSNFGASLETAANKVSAGTRFDMTAAEKVAWDKTRVDLAEVAPGFKSLSDKAIAEKMLDRKWVEDTAVKAREKAAAFEQIAAKAETERLRQTAIANRERMMGIAEDMEASLQTPRPVSRGGQGPKTRAFQQNRLSPDQELLNSLLGK